MNSKDRLLTTLFLVSLAVSGCSAEPADKQVDRDPPPGLVANFHWLDSAALNLRSPEASAIRAAVESDESATQAEDRTRVYPGFTSAFTAASDELDYYGPGPFPGIRIVDEALIMQSIVADGQTLTAKVCTAGRLTRRLDNSTTDIGFSLYTVVIRRSGTPPPSDQVGPSDRPAQSVFGGWRIESIDTEYPKPLPVGCSAAKLASAVGQPSRPGWPGPAGKPTTTNTSPTS